MQVSSLGFGTDLMVRRLAGSIITEYDDHLVVATPTNPAFWWGNFVLVRGPLAAGDAHRVRSIFDEALPGARLTIGLEGCEDAGPAGEVASLGLETVADIVLTAALVKAPPAPPRGRLQALHTDEDWRGLAALREAWQGPPSDDADRSFRALRLDEERGLVERGAASWFGAWSGDQLVSALGIVSDRAGVARYQEVETHPDHRRRGHVRHLLHLAATYAAQELAATTFVIVAEPGYHAIELYRSVGFRDTEVQVKLQTVSPES